jgi:hypothetical protein
VGTRATTHRLLRAHFLHRFIDNDLISPNADRHDAIVLIATSLAVPGLVVTVLLIGSKYLFGIPTPALTSIAALDDKFLYISVSMLVMALIGAVQWDALDLDARDEAILGPLPLTHVEIARAKLAALVIFVSAFAVALNAVPSIVFPLLLVAHFHVNIIAVVRLILTHATVTTLAGAWAFLSVVFIRELLRLVLSASWFRRVSAVVQGVLVLTLGSTLLLTPWLATGVPMKWMDGSSAARAVPPVWFVGLYESSTKGITLTIRGLGLRIPKGLIPAEANAHVVYDRLLARFGAFAQMALLVTVVTLLATLALYAWNNKRLPAPTAGRWRRRSIGRSIAAVLIALFVARRPLERAGFFFTLQTLARSVSHRMSIAAAGAVAFAVSVMFMHGIRAISGVAYAETRVLALQTIAISIVLVGVRKAVGTPAELRANWIFPMAWNGEVGPYVAGVKRAVIIAIIVPMLLALLAFDWYEIGARVALAHAPVAFIVSVLVLDMLLWQPEMLPLTCSSRPPGNLKAFGPIYLMVLFVGAYTLARIERAAIADATRYAVLLAAFATIYIGFRLWDARYHRRATRIVFDDSPETPTQRLGLGEPV